MELDLRQHARERSLAIAPPDELAGAVIATWRGRMINEYASSWVFDGLAAQLDALGATTDAEACRRFGDEEREHGALCAAVVAAAGGEAVGELAPARAIPTHADTTARAAVVRNVLSICCLSETVAVALIGAERLEMRDGALRTLLTQIWSDEIGHARFGWRYLSRVLPALDADERAAVERYLPIALAALERHELAHLPVATAWPSDAAMYGLCDGGDARALFADVVRDVIVPQLEALGLSAAARSQ